MARRSIVLAAAVAAMAASLVLYRTRRRRRKLTPSTATERWESEGGAILPAGDTGYG